MNKLTDLWWSCLLQNDLKTTFGEINVGHSRQDALARVCGPAGCRLEGGRGRVGRGLVRVPPTLCLMSMVMRRSLGGAFSYSRGAPVSRVPYAWRFRRIRTANRSQD